MLGCLWKMQGAINQDRLGQITIHIPLDIWIVGDQRHCIFVPRFTAPLNECKQSGPTCASKNPCLIPEKGRDNRIIIFDFADGASIDANSRHWEQEST